MLILIFSPCLFFALIRHIPFCIKKTPAQSAANEIFVPEPKAVIAKKIGLDDFDRKIRIFFNKAFAAILAFSAVFFIISLDIPKLAETKEEINYEKRMVDEYVINHPDDFFIHDGTLILNNASIFTVYPDKKPSNLVFWGGSGMFSPIWKQQLSLNGLDSLNAKTLTRDDVYVLSRGIGAGFEMYLQNKYPGWAFVKVGENKSVFNIYKFEKVY